MSSTTTPTVERIAALAAHLSIPEGDVSETRFDVNTYDAGGLGEWLVLTDDEADEAAAEAIERDLFAFHAWFLVPYMPDGVDEEVIKAIAEAKYEDASPILANMIGGNMADLVEAAISADGRGHFLSFYDGEEIELEGNLYAYRTN